MTALFEPILEPFTFPFMQQAFLITMIIAVPMALLSCYMVLKGWSLMGDAISHAVLPGVVLAYIVGLPLAIGAFAAGITCALSAGYLTSNSRVKEDTILGVVFSGMFGLGLVMYVSVETDVHLDHILFGDMLGVTRRDIAETALISVLATAFVLLKRRDLLVQAFDSQHAKAIGLPTTFLHYALLAVLSLTIVGALKAIGIILAIGLLVAPGAIAFLVARTFPGMLLTAVAVTLFSAFTGIYASFFLDSAPAPTIILVMTGIFVLVFVHTLMRQNAADQKANLPTRSTHS